MKNSISLELFRIRNFVQMEGNRLGRLGVQSLSCFQFGHCSRLCVLSSNGEVIWEAEL
jgi:hypothetical protein